MAKALSHLTHGHVKLPCGCRVCLLRGINAAGDNHINQGALEKFHEHIHRVQAQHAKAEAKRPKPMVSARARRLAARKPVPVHVSKLHKHTARCRASLDEFVTGYGKPNVISGLVWGSEVHDVPKHINLAITVVSDRDTRGHTTTAYFPTPSKPFVALDWCRVTGSGIPAKRVPVELTKAYRQYWKETAM